MVYLGVAQRFGTTPVGCPNGSPSTVRRASTTSGSPDLIRLATTASRRPEWPHCPLWAYLPRNEVRYHGATPLEAQPPYSRFRYSSTPFSDDSWDEPSSTSTNSSITASGTSWRSRTVMSTLAVFCASRR